MAKTYKTAGRDLHNYRGRTGRLVLVPTPKTPSGYAACDTYGNACRVLKSCFDPDVVRVETEPWVPILGRLGGGIHLDIIETRRSAALHFTEVRDTTFITPKSEQDQANAKAALEARGHTYEFTLRDDALAAAHAESLAFLLRFKSIWKPSEAQLAVIRVICAEDIAEPRSRWLRKFRSLPLPAAAALYWAVAHGYLRLLGVTGLFPDGLLAGGPR